MSVKERVQGNRGIMRWQILVVCKVQKKKNGQNALYSNKPNYFFDVAVMLVSLLLLSSLSPL